MFISASSNSTCHYCFTIGETFGKRTLSGSRKNLLIKELSLSLHMERLLVSSLS